MEGFEELRVWRLAMDLVVEVYRISARFPKEEMYGLTSQIRRAAVSIASNIAEGNGRGSTKDYLRHISIALGSLAEAKTQLHLAVRLKFTDAMTVDPIIKTTNSVGKMLHSLRSALRRKLAEP